MKSIYFLSILFVVAATTQPVVAETPLPSITATQATLEQSESVNDLTDRGMHFEAISRVIQAAQLNLSEKVAAARSAWALGLVEMARSYWDEALVVPEFEGIERSRALLARSILELQEGSLEKARMLAEKSANGLTRSDLKAQLWLVIAESLKEQGAPSLAEGYYRKAIEDGSDAIAQEGRFLLGECLLELGRLPDARYSFASVDIQSPIAHRALRRLAEIDLMQKHYEGVLTWIKEGRDLGAAELRDSWSSYASATALSAVGNRAEAEKELADSKVRFSDSDRWYQLAEAAVAADNLRALMSPKKGAPRIENKEAYAAPIELLKIVPKLKAKDEQKEGRAALRNADPLKNTEALRSAENIEEVTSGE